MDDRPRIATQPNRDILQAFHQDATDIPSPMRLEVVFQSATEALSWLSDAGIDNSADET